MVENHLNYLVSVLFSLLVCSMSEDGPKYPCELWESVEIDNSSRFENGSVSFDNVMYPSDLIFYASSDVDKNVTSLRGCICSLKTCIYKCCAFGSSVGAEGCGPGTKELTLDSIKFHEYKIGNDEIKVLENKDKTDYAIVHYPIREKCKALDAVFSYYGSEDDEHFMLENGTLLIKTWNELRDDIITYCLEYEENENKISPLACNRNAESGKDQSVEEQQITTDELVIGISISIPFLLITFIVYCITPELQNIFGKSILSQVATLTVSYIALLLNHVRPAFIFEYFGKKYACAFLGYVSHFALLSNFFWLSVMCFDIWLVFSGFSRSYRNLSKQEEIKRFVKYSCYAWGTPLLICIAIYFTDMNYQNLEPRNKNLLVFCMMRWEYAWQLFYIGPLMLTLVTNAVLFSATAFNIYKHKKQSRKVLKSDDNSCSSPVEKERLKLYLKLFVIMGVTWIFEPLSLIFNNKPLWFWRIMDRINSLHGVTMFVLFVCKKRILRPINNISTSRLRSMLASSKESAGKELTIMTTPSSNVKEGVTNKVTHNLSIG